MEKNCKCCNNKFYTIKNNKKFCSKQCLKRYHNNKNKIDLIEKICKVCNKPFQTKIKKTILCSYKCRANNQRLKYKTKNRLGSTKQCKLCGENFILKASNQKFCSSVCRISYTTKEKQVNLPKKVIIKKQAFKIEFASINELLDEFGSIE
jgi:hypothetical protein